MTRKLMAAAAAGYVWVLLALAGSAQSLVGAELKLEAQLLWGTDESKPPAGKDWKPVDPALKKRIPLRWTNYFEVHRKSVVVKQGETRKEPMSDKCEIEIKNIDNSNLEVTLFGQGKKVMNRKQALPKEEILVLGGNAPNETAWLVVLKQVEQ